jgi:hypothetical protein
MTVYPKDRPAGREPAWSEAALLTRSWPSFGRLRGEVSRSTWRPACRSMSKATSSATWYAHVVGYVDKRWPGAAANTRKSMLEALATVTAALVSDRPNRPEFAELYRALMRYALPPAGRIDPCPPKAARALRWLESASVPLVALKDEDIVERALSAIALRLDGKAAAATVARRKRAVFYNALDMAATGKRRSVARNPLDTMRWKPPEVAEKVDRRFVANPRQVREMLAALSYVGGSDRERAGHLPAMSPSCNTARCVRLRQ